MKITLVPNIFDQNSHQNQEVEFKLQSALEHFQENFPELDQKDFYPVCLGERISWDHLVADNHLIFINELRGGKNSGIVQIVMGFAAIGLAWATWGTSLALAQPMLMFGIGMVLSGGAAMLFKPAAPDAGGFDDSATYNWNGIQNTVGEGTTIPVVYGYHRVGGHVIEAYTSNKDMTTSGSDDEYLNAVLAISNGPIEHIDQASIEINGQPLHYFKNSLGTPYIIQPLTEVVSAVDDISKVSPIYRELKKLYPAEFLKDNETTFAVNLETSSPYTVNTSIATSKADIEVKRKGTVITCTNDYWRNISASFIGNSGFNNLLDGTWTFNIPTKINVSIRKAGEVDFKFYKQWDYNEAANQAITYHADKNVVVGSNLAPYEFSGLNRTLSIVFPQKDVWDIKVEEVASSYYVADIAAAMKNWYLNYFPKNSTGVQKTLLQNADAEAWFSANFTNQYASNAIYYISLNGQSAEAIIETRNGYPDQSPLNFFTKIVRQHTLTGVRLLSQAGHTYQTQDYVNAGKFEITFPALYKVGDLGDTQELGIDFLIEYRKQGDAAWTTAEEFEVKAAKTSSYTYFFYIPVPEYNLYDFRITRLTEDHDESTTKFSECYLTTVLEIEDGAIAYNNTAILGLALKATDKLSGKMPTITVNVFGRVLRDVRTGALEWGNNPANIIYDLLTNKLYGLGKKLDDTQINIESLKEFADFSDELVPYHYKYNFDILAYSENKNYRPGTIVAHGGKYYRAVLSTYVQDPKVPTNTSYWVEVSLNQATSTVTEMQKRFEFNISLDKEFRATELIQKICESCRAKQYWAQDMFAVVIDKAKVARQSFTMGNIIKDSYSETFINTLEIPNQIEADILDENNNFERTTVIYADEARLSESHLVESKSINLFGLSHIARVKREIAHNFRKVKAQIRTISFTTGLEGVVSSIGDVIQFSHDAGGYNQSGSIVKVEGNVVTFSNDLFITGGVEYNLFIRNPDNTTRTIPLMFGQSQTVNQLTLQGTTLIVGSLYAFGQKTYEYKLFSITSISRLANSAVRIDALEYNESVYSDSEDIDIDEWIPNGININGPSQIDGDPIVVDDPSFKIPPFVTSVTLSQINDINALNEPVPHIRVDFGGVHMPYGSTHKVVRYDILYSEDALTWRKYAETITSAEPVIIQNVEYGKTYYVVVNPYTEEGVTNNIELTEYRDDWSISIIVPSVTTISSISTVGGFRQILIMLNHTKGNEFGEYEVRGGPTNVFAETNWTIITQNSQIVHSGLDLIDQRFYWARVKDRYGNYSPWYPGADVGGVEGNTNQDPEWLADWVARGIDDTWLLPDLRSEIQLISSTSADLIAYEASNDGRVAAIEVDVDGITSQVSAHNSSIGTLQSEVQQSEDQFKVKIVWNTTLGKYITTGFGIGFNTATSQSETVFDVDRFIIAKPGTNKSASPFILDTGLNALILNADLIANGSIVANKIGASAITADKINANAVTADKINASAVTAAKIAAGAITATKISAGTIETSHLIGETVSKTVIAQCDCSNALSCFLYNDSPYGADLLVHAAMNSGSSGGPYTFELEVTNGTWYDTPTWLSGAGVVIGVIHMIRNIPSGSSITITWSSNSATAKQARVAAFFLKR